MGIERVPAKKMGLKNTRDTEKGLIKMLFFNRFSEEKYCLDNLQRHERREMQINSIDRQTDSIGQARATDFPHICFSLPTAS